MKAKNKILIWDLPVRFFHWLLVIGFFSASLIAFGFDDENIYFPMHAILGLIIVFMVILRIIYGFIGTTYARFNSFLFHPKEVFLYFKGIISGSNKSYSGHNPGSSYAIFIMLLLLIGLAITGISLALGNETFEDLHELFANSMLVIVSLHILGVILHIVINRQNIIASMIHGKKESGSGTGIDSSKPISLIIFLVLLVSFTFYLLTSFNISDGTIDDKITGVKLKIGESENGREHNTNYEHDEDDD